jgi:transcriptional regulator with XRE-family HTH domain
MSQRELARRSGVSSTNISLIESAGGFNASPFTLRAIAEGLSTYEYDDDVRKVDEARADVYYGQLMEAAGYLTGLPFERPKDEIDEGDVLRFLTERAGDVTISERLLRLADRYPELSEDDQLVVRRLVDTWIRD